MSFFVERNYTLEDIRTELPPLRSVLIKSHSLSEEDSLIRTTNEALLILESAFKIQDLLIEAFTNHPSLESIFEKDFGKFRDFLHRETLVEICYLDDYFFPESQSLPIGIQDQFSPSILHDHVQTIQLWIEEKIKFHAQTLEKLRGIFDVETQERDLDCKCHICFAEFRSKLRDLTFFKSKDSIVKLETSLMQNLDNWTFEQASNEVQRTQKDIEKLVHGVRHKLKRASLNKLEAQILGLLKDKLAFDTAIGKAYAAKLKSFFNVILKEKDLREDLVTESEYERFFQQLGANLWRGEKALAREFSKLLSSLLVLKRKDISAKILMEYLGQFWLHSDARKMSRKIVYHQGPTNSGKTYNAIQALSKVASGCYLAPLRLLAGELYDTLNEMGVKTTLLTGEEVIETEEATHISSTIEMAKLDQDFECCVIDEIQMISDSQRGWAWTRALVNIKAKEIHICGDASVTDLIRTIVELTGDTLEIKEYQRMTELKVMGHPITLIDLQRSDALIVFSRRNALKFKRDLERLSFKVSIVYGRLSPEVRREQARKFDVGETDIIVSTDAIAMGMNLPIKRIIFSTIVKFFDSKEIKITNSEIKQIAGRAGRFKRFPVGLVTCLSRESESLEDIQEALQAPLEQSEKAMVGPDLDIFSKVNNALSGHGLPILHLTEFLRLFNTMEFKKPFYCVDLKEMIEIAEMVEEANSKVQILSDAEIFGFTCAPVNLGLMEHVQYFVHILTSYVHQKAIVNEEIDYNSDNIDYLETSIKCVELFQWLARHFDKKNFEYNEMHLLTNKGFAIDKLNELLSNKIVPYCSSCGTKLHENTKFAICEGCFQKRKFGPRRGAAKNFDSKKGQSGSKKKDFSSGFQKRRPKKQKRSFR